MVIYQFTPRGFRLDSRLVYLVMDIWESSWNQRSAWERKQPGYAGHLLELALNRLNDRFDDTMLKWMSFAMQPYIQQLYLRNPSFRKRMGAAPITTDDRKRFYKERFYKKATYLEIYQVLLSMYLVRLSLEDPQIGNVTQDEIWSEDTPRSAALGAMALGARTLRADATDAIKDVRVALVRLEKILGLSQTVNSDKDRLTVNPDNRHSDLSKAFDAGVESTRHASTSNQKERLAT